MGFKKKLLTNNEGREEYIDSGMLKIWGPITAASYVMEDATLVVQELLKVDHLDTCCCINADHIFRSGEKSKINVSQQQ
jgi:hypothetical protein